MESYRMSEWANLPAFAAKGQTIGGVLEDPADDSPMWVEPGWVVILSGSAIHLPTGTELEARTAIFFEPGEAWQLRVTEDVRYWYFRLSQGPDDQ
jgi:hypothetical protein